MDDGRLRHDSSSADKSSRDKNIGSHIYPVVVGELDSPSCNAPQIHKACSSHLKCYKWMHVTLTIYSMIHDDCPCHVKTLTAIPIWNHGQTLDNKEKGQVRIKLFPPICMYFSSDMVLPYTKKRIPQVLASDFQDIFYLETLLSRCMFKAEGILSLIGFILDDYNASYTFQSFILHRCTQQEHDPSITVTLIACIYTWLRKHTKYKLSLTTGKKILTIWIQPLWVVWALFRQMTLLATNEALCIRKYPWKKYNLIFILSSWCYCSGSHCCLLH